MARFYALFSSSKGNAHYIGTPEQGLLIDAGVSYKRLEQALLERQLSLSGIQGVFITHTHTDHVKGLSMLLKKMPAIKVWATEDTLETLLNKGILREQHVGGVMNVGTPVSIGGYTVNAFATQHDTAGSCGFRIETPDNRSCSVCTDLGCVTETVLDAICGSDMVLLEANYDADMLRNGSYPDELKERISGTYGHLSNTESGEVARKLVTTGTTRIALGHISQENNTPMLAEAAVLDALNAGNFKRNQDYMLTVLAPDGCREMVVF